MLGRGEDLIIRAVGSHAASSDSSPDRPGHEPQISDRRIRKSRRSRGGGAETCRDGHAKTDMVLETLRGGNDPLPNVFKANVSAFSENALMPRSRLMLEVRSTATSDIKIVELALRRRASFFTELLPARSLLPWNCPTVSKDNFSRSKESERSAACFPDSSERPGQAAGATCLAVPSWSRGRRRRSSTLWQDCGGEQRERTAL